MAQLDNRKPREQELHVAEQIHESYDDSWESPQLLDTRNIPARPGFVQRWIRTRDKSGDDQSNVFKKINQGWKPRMLDSVPKGQFIPNLDFNGQQVIGIHGMILMERPEQIQQKHAAYTRRMTQAQQQAVAANIQNLRKTHDPNSGVTVPVMHSSSTTTRGRTPTIDD